MDKRISRIKSTAASNLAKMSPEGRKKVEDFRKGIGAALVGNLNKNVLADNPVRGNEQSKLDK